MDIVNQEGDQNFTHENTQDFTDDNNYYAI